MVLLVEHHREGVSAPRSSIPLGLGHPFVEPHRLAMLCFYMDTRQASNIRSIARVPAILGRAPRIKAVLTELGGKQPLKPGTLLLAVHCHVITSSQKGRSLSSTAWKPLFSSWMA